MELGPFTFWELLTCVVVVSVLVSVVGVWYSHRRLSGRVSEGHNDVIVPIYATAGVIYAVLLAFIVIAVWEAFTASTENVADEASALATMYRQSVALPNPERGALREELRTYTDAVIGREWKEQEHGGTSSAARTAIVNMYRTVGDQPSRVLSNPVNVQVLQEIGTVASDRNKRTLSSQENLPWVLWLALIVGDVVLIVMSFLLYMSNAWMHAICAALVAAMTGVLLFITLVLNHPFQGKLGIRPDAFEHSAKLYDQVDQNP